VRIFDPVAGGEVVLVIEVNASSLEVFEDPTTGAPRLACASGEKVLVFDPVAGGEALLVLDECGWLAVFKEPATGAPRLVCASEKKVLVFDPITGGDALLVFDFVFDDAVSALAVFKDPATSELRLACGTGNLEAEIGDVRIYDPVAGGEALLVLDAGLMVLSLVTFNDLATGALRLASGCFDGKVRVFDPVAGGEALVVLEGHTFWVAALTAFTDPVTGEPRLVSAASNFETGDGTVRVWNPAARQSRRSPRGTLMR
jgi:WD40 repeat protein